QVLMLDGDRLCLAPKLRHLRFQFFDGHDLIPQAQDPNRDVRRPHLERVDFQPVDLEAATRDALAYLARFRDVLEKGTLEQRKEFLRGFVHEISIDPDTARGTIIFYELPVTSLMMVPGVGVEPTQARGPRHLKSLASTVSATPAPGCWR